MRTPCEAKDEKVRKVQPEIKAHTPHPPPPAPPDPAPRRQNRLTAKQALAHPSMNTVPDFYPGFSDAVPGSLTAAEASGVDMASGKGESYTVGRSRTAGPPLLR